MKALFLVLALAGCATVSPEPALNPVAAIGQAARAGPFVVRPIAVVEDSRCPANVQCVWAGRLRLLAEINYDGSSEVLRRELVLGTPLPLPAGTVTLSDARPAPVAGRPIDPAAYRFIFTFQGTR